MKSHANSFILIIVISVIGIIIHSGCVSSSDGIIQRLGISGRIKKPGMYDLRITRNLCVADVVKVAGGLDTTSTGFKAAFYREGADGNPIVVVQENQWQTPFIQLGLNIRQFKLIEITGRYKNL
jgi:hypothetical protein